VLEECVFCDEKIVIDSFSTDKTVEIARGLGASVVQHEFTNYVMQNRWRSIARTGEWVLLMDADEQATHDLGEEIIRAVSSSDTADGYRIRRILYHLGHYYSHAIYPDTPVRLFMRIASTDMPSLAPEQSHRRVRINRVRVVMPQVVQNPPNPIAVRSVRRRDRTNNSSPRSCVACSSASSAAPFAGRAIERHLFLHHIVRELMLNDAGAEPACDLDSLYQSKTNR